MDFNLFFFSFHGFRDAITIKNIDDIIIDSLEKFIQEKITGVISKYETTTKLDKSMFFGIFEDGKDFNISMGERVQLKEIAAYAKKICDTVGPLYFCDKKNAKIVNFNNTVDCEIGRLFIEPIGYDETKLKTALHSRVLELLKSAQISQNIIDEFSQDMVRIGYKNDIPHGGTKCVLCQTNDQKKMTEHAVSAKVDGMKVSWILSNFIKHLRSTNKLNIEKKARKKQKSDAPNPEMGASQNASIKQKDDASCNDEEVIEVLDEFYVDIDTKIEETRNEICAKLSAQALNMVETIEELEDEIGFSTIDFIYRPIKVVTIKKDGNCLFGALVHQLYKTDTMSDNHTTLTNQLRQETMAYISNNRLLFKSELESRVYEKKAKKTVKNIDDDIQKLLNRLSTDGSWAGTETLKAIQMIHRSNILVINESGDFYFSPPFMNDLDKMLILAFRLREDVSSQAENISNDKRNHYESVVHIEADDVFSISQILSDKIKKKSIGMLQVEKYIYV